MRLLFIGCVHGRYDIITTLNSKEQPDLIILLGDLQAFETKDELSQSKIPIKYQKLGSYKDFNITTPIIALYGNHELPKHCQLNPFLIKSNFCISGTSTVKFVKNNRIITFNSISGITSTKPSNPFYLNSESLKNINIRISPDYIISHEWPSQAAKFDRKIIKQFGKLKGENSQKILEISSFNQQTTWIASHMHCQYEGWVFQGKNKVKFIGLNKCEFGGFIVQEHNGSKTELDDGIYWDKIGEKLAKIM